MKSTGPLPLWLTEFWVQQQICGDADNDESHDKHRHPIGQFPLPSGNPGSMTVEGTATDHNAGYSRRPGGRWPSGLVATAAEDRLSFRRNPHTSFAAASDCRTIAI